LIIVSYFEFSSQGALKGDVGLITLGIINCVSSIPIIFYINYVSRMKIIKLGAVGMAVSWAIVLVY